MKYFFKFFLFLMLLLCISLNAQDMKKSLFGELDKKMAEAIELGLDILAPTNFENANNNYKDALKDYEDGANLSGIKEQISNAVKFLDAAKEKAKVSSITLKNSIAARNDAKKVDAEKNAPELWKQAEEKFRDAGEEVEDGDIPDAEEASNEAEELFRSAELTSIKLLYLDETRNLISSAKEADAESYTPKTLEKAIGLLNSAEKELSENRYDTDQPRSLAQQAKYEANHAIFLTKVIKDFEDSDRTMEDLKLSYEVSFQKIASHFDYEAKFDQPVADVTNRLVQELVELKTDLQNEQQTNMDLNREIKVLKEELSGLTKEKSQLDAKMAKLAELKAKVEKINQMFSDNEAEVLREGNDIYIRLKGLNFAVGKAVIEPANFGLLTKVQNAIKEFPGSSIVVEGHTDSYGSDEKNLELSQERASAVKQYIIANMSMDEKKIMAMGYGETKPIANNETKEGRTKNRRIDLIIKNAE